MFGLFKVGDQTFGDMRRSIKGGSHEKCVPPELAAHAANLLAATPELENITGSDACEAAHPSTDPRTSKCWGAGNATPEQPVPLESLACRALKSALAMYDVSLAVSRSSCHGHVTGMCQQDSRRWHMTKSLLEWRPRCIICFEAGIVVQVWKGLQV